MCCSEFSIKKIQTSWSDFPLDLGTFLKQNLLSLFLVARLVEGMVCSRFLDLEMQSV